MCQTAAGAYFLPKKLIDFTITQADDNAVFKLNFDGTSSVADRQRAFCLDYLGSPLADDTVHVERDGQGLLKLISSVADDKSKQIAETLIESASSGRPETRTLALGARRSRAAPTTFLPTTNSTRSIGSNWPKSMLRWRRPTDTASSWRGILFHHPIIEATATIHVQGKVQSGQARLQAPPGLVELPPPLNHSGCRITGFSIGRISDDQLLSCGVGSRIA